MGFESSRIAENLEYDNDLYMGPVSQVIASRWSEGRFVLVGDAAYGPSPITGMGTTLAITGAYVLAGELAKSESIPAALESYERVLRPFVEKSQQLPPGVPAIAHPKTRWGVAILNTAARTAASKPVQWLLTRKKPKKKSRDEFNLPSYSF